MLLKRETKYVNIEYVINFRYVSSDLFINVHISCTSLSLDSDRISHVYYSKEECHSVRDLNCWNSYKFLKFESTPIIKLFNNISRALCIQCLNKVIYLNVLWCKPSQQERLFYVYWYRVACISWMFLPILCQPLHHCNIDQICFLFSRILYVAEAISKKFHHITDHFSAWC